MTLIFKKIPKQISLYKPYFIKLFYSFGWNILYNIFYFYCSNRFSQMQLAVKFCGLTGVSRWYPRPAGFTFLTFAISHQPNPGSTTGARLRKTSNSHTISCHVSNHFTSFRCTCFGLSRTLEIVRQCTF